MGHEVQYFTYNENVNQRKVNDELDEYARIEGRKKSGGLPGPIRWIDRILPNREAAEKYISEHDDGYYDQLAVKYREYDPGVEPSKKLKLLEERWGKEKRKKAEYALAHSVSSFKADYIGCPDCGSKLKRTLLKGENCPLCRAELRSKTTIETLARYDANLQALRDQMSEERHKQQEKNIKKSTVKWLVKIEWHE